MIVKSNNTNHIERAASLYDTPFYFIDQLKIKKSVEVFLNAFENVHPNFTLAYPYKVNNIKRLLQYYHSIGLWAEVSSDLELEMATRLGVAANKIIFNGPYKSTNGLSLASASGVTIFVDNEAELNRLEVMAQELDIHVQIGIRVNSLEAKNNWGKFGFTIEDGKAFEIATRLSQSKWLTLIALHAHFGSNISDINHYEKMMRLYSGFTIDLLQNKLINLQLVDIGSGFAIPQPRPIGANNWQTPRLSEYASRVKKIFSFLPSDIRFIAEPGRILVSDAVSLITKIISIKRTKDKVFAVVDAGVNMIPGRDIYSYPVKKLGNHERVKTTKVDVHGALCDSYDNIALDIYLPDPKVGDILCIKNVGAYDLVRSFGWNLGLPPVILHTLEGDLIQIRERQTSTDVWNLQI